jgi:hypothetical protein
MNRVHGVALALALSMGLAGAASAQITASYYQYGQWTDDGAGVGMTFGTAYQVDQISSINNYDNNGPAAFNTDPNFPSASIDFGADFKSLINVSVAGDYVFTMISDDGGYLFLDGAIIAEAPGDHYSELENSPTLDLTQGLHSIEFQMNNHGLGCCAQATVDLPQGVTYFAAAGVPEPATWALTILGFGLTGAGLRRRRASPLAA